MLPFTTYCNEGHKNAETDFESSLYKLLANAFYGKTVENMRDRVNVRLISDRANLSRPLERHSTGARGS